MECLGTPTARVTCWPSHLPTRAAQDSAQQRAEEAEERLRSAELRVTRLSGLEDRLRERSAAVEDLHTKLLAAEEALRTARSQFAAEVGAAEDALRRALELNAAEMVEVCCVHPCDTLTLP